MRLSDCPHIHLIKLAGPLHEGGKDYLCQDCKDCLRVEMKPLKIKVSYPHREPAENCISVELVEKLGRENAGR